MAPSIPKRLVTNDGIDRLRKGNQRPLHSHPQRGPQRPSRCMEIPAELVEHFIALTGIIFCQLAFYGTI